MSTAAITRRRLPKWVPVAGWSLLGLVCAALFLFVVIVTFGAVRGMEFCPQTFERRSYWLHELPLTGIQVTGIRRKDESQATELFITSNKYVTAPAAGAKQDWHLIAGMRGVASTKGDAGILMTYLDAKDGDDYHRWVKWSEEHPKLAPILWPAIQRLAQHELYIFVPDLFDLAKTIEDPVKLRQELDRTVASKLLFLARRLQGRGDRPAAELVLEEAVQLDSASQEIKDALATAQNAATDK